MSDPIYKHITLTGTSSTSIEAAVDNAVARARKTLRNLRWFVVREVRGTVTDAGVQQWQVTVEIGFGLEPDSD